MTEYVSKESLLKWLRLVKEASRQVLAAEGLDEIIAAVEKSEETYSQQCPELEVFVDQKAMARLAEERRRVKDGSEIDKLMYVFGEKMRAVDHHSSACQVLKAAEENRHAEVDEVVHRINEKIASGGLGVKPAEA